MKRRPNAYSSWNWLQRCQRQLMLLGRAPSGCHRTPPGTIARLLNRHWAVRKVTPQRYDNRGARDDRAAPTPDLHRRCRCQFFDDTVGGQIRVSVEADKIAGDAGEEMERQERGPSRRGAKQRGAARDRRKRDPICSPSYLVRELSTTAVSVETQAVRSGDVPRRYDGFQLKYHGGPRKQLSRAHGFNGSCRGMVAVPDDPESQGEARRALTRRKKSVRPSRSASRCRQVGRRASRPCTPRKAKCSCHARSQTPRNLVSLRSELAWSATAQAAISRCRL